MRSTSRIVALLVLAHAAAAFALIPRHTSAPFRVVDLRVTGEERLFLDATVPEGDHLRLTFPGGATYAVAPVASDRSGSRFRLTLLRGHGPAEDPAFTPVETVGATRGRPVSFRALPGVTVAVVRLREVRSTGAGS